MSRYVPKEFEHKWVAEWQKQGIYKMPKIKKGDKKFYSLYSFPYPSGAGLHVGHVEGMVANDIAARFARMQGIPTILPMGWDSFGLPAENYAIKTGIHPKDSTDEVIVTFKDQINKVGISVDWNTEVGAHWPEYYKWTQWIFLQLYKKGLAYQKEAAVNWCPKDNTVLANEQVVDGKCERCGTEVVQKKMKQWFFKITAYAEQLEKDLDTLDWPKSTKDQQRNWIGKSVGINITYQVEGVSEPIVVFTTRPETNFGATFVVLAPESDYVQRHVNEFPNAVEVATYVEETKKKTERTRLQDKTKTGVFTGVYAINNLNGKKLPVYVGDFVLATVGTGALVGVPGHDMRDFEFAQAMGCEIIRVVIGPDGDTSKITRPEQVHEGAGTMTNSSFLDGMKTMDAKEKIMDYLEDKGWGERVTNYRLRDWLVSRQRYWGAPIPIVYDPEGNPHPVDESDLPVLLPYNVDFKPTGESPLKYSEEFHKSAEAKYGKGWRREVDTMDTFVDSSWYFFRHLCARDDTQAFDSETVNAWLPTDLYMIGAEHIVLHLLYSRFFTKVFHDAGLIDFNEPFYRMRHMGIILGPDNRKMSKRWGNVINPTDVVNEFGADTLRVYEMFMGPLDQVKPWNPQNVQGAYRFLQRIWKLYTEGGVAEAGADGDLAVARALQKTIVKVTADIPELKFNTAIAAMMALLNEWEGKQVSIAHAKQFLQILAPFAPFIAEELWQEVLGETESIHTSQWPTVDTSLLQDDTVTIPVQVNGKMRGTVRVSVSDKSQEAVMQEAKKHDKIAPYLNQEIVKIIYVTGKILNIIVKS
jgi:leucyl-tRNA synthetase